MFTLEDSMFGAEDRIFALEDSVFGLEHSKSNPRLFPPPPGFSCTTEVGEFTLPPRFSSTPGDGKLDGLPRNTTSAGLPMSDRMTFNLRIACEADAKEIASLVNRAYRPSPQDAGWTHESGLIAGDRSSTEQVLALFREQSTILLLCLGQRIVACVHVQGRPSGASIGMLATEPARQAQGLGKQMLRHAERYAAEHFGASVLRMSVLSSRPALLAFYQRRAYVLTGEVEDYPLAAGVGKPIVEGVHLLSLIKTPANSSFDWSAQPAARRPAGR